MILNDKIINLNKQGFVPGPHESEEDFEKRVQKVQNILFNPKKYFEKQPFSLDDPLLKPRFSWAKQQLKELFDIHLDTIPCFFSDDKMTFFQGAKTWIFEKEGIKYL